MKKIIPSFLLLLTLSACSMTPTGPAEDKWDEEQKEDRIKLDSIFNSKDKAVKENEDLKARLEKLERQQGTTRPAINTSQQGSDISAPPIFQNQQSVPNVDPSWQNSASYAEWKRSRETQSGDYQEFKEYQQWLEFQKLKSK